MRQRTFAFYDTYDVVTFLETIKNDANYLSAKSVLVNVFTDRNNSGYIGYISNIIKKRLPNAKISGLTCIAGFLQGEVRHSTTVLSLFFFDSSDIEVLEYDFSKTDEQTVKSEILSAIEKTPDLKGLQVFSTLVKNTVTGEILSSITSKYEDIPIFGAGAGFPEKGNDRNLYVFGEKIYENAIVLTLFKGKGLRIYAESTLGWTPIGKIMEATDVLDKRILKTIDGECAGEIFKKYLGVSSSENFIDNTCEFPLMFRSSGKWIARVPVHKDENGFVHFAADIKKGEKLVFSYGAKNIILRSAFNLADYMSRKNLEGLLLHVCRTRFFYLKDEETLELQAFSNFYREACGCFAFSEILYKNKGEGLLNSALVAVGFREDKDDDNNPYFEDCFVEDVRHGNSYFSDFRVLESESADGKKIIPFGERIVSFLHATSRDLYLANVKLEEAATTDGLTKIYNRKKIYECIASALKEKNSAGSTDLNLIMFDIDNFKRINDTYGHDIGDEVLRVVAQTAKKCIEGKDSIGRWGGEEFMILLPDSKKDIALFVAEKIRSQINAIKWEKMPCVSVSVGVSEMRPGDDCQTLYKRVDERLYYAKTHGKNRVIGEDFD